MDATTLQLLETAEGILITAAIGYAAERYRRWTGSTISLNDQKLLEGAAMNGLAAAQRKLAAGEPVNSVVADAVSYVRTMRPQLVAKGDKDKTTPADWLERFVEAVAAKPDATLSGSGAVVPGPTHSDFVAAAMQAAETGSFTIPAGVRLDQPVKVAPAPKDVVASAIVPASSPATAAPAASPADAVSQLGAAA